ncbi:MAG: carbohydrate ABC transporter permease [Spirochaetia bacterium]
MENNDHIKEYRSKNSPGFRFFNTALMIFVILVTLYPIWYITVTSLSSENAVVSGKVSLVPISPTLKAYELAFTYPTFWIGYRNTIVYTLTGTLIGICLNIMCAYPLSRKRLWKRSLLTKFFVFTMFFNGGIIPNYVLINSLGWIDTIWAVVVPPAVTVWHLMIVRTFFQTIPETLEEAAQIDGMNSFQILLRIILPLSKPILAVIALFLAVFQWNNWFGPLIYLNSTNKYPVTLILRNILDGARLAAEEGRDIDAIPPAETLKASAIIIVTFPILMLYPFLQRYFVKGMLIGSIKG